LAWKIGNGHRARLGADLWMGSEGKHLILDQITLLLRIKGFDTLDKLADPDATNFWTQGWKLAIGLKLNDADTSELEIYITILKETQVILRDQEEKLVWKQTASGLYTPKEAHDFLIREQVQAELVCWWTKLRRINCPTKSKLFMWSVLTNKLSTWDILQKRNFSSLGRCPLCKT
jgi:hypothetical protein